VIKSQELFFEYKAYDEGEAATQVLNGIDISIADGEFVAILGHNGSGKSTLARHLNALLVPTSGTLWVNGKDTSDPANVWNIRQSTGMLFQNPDNQIVASTVEEDVAFGPENLGIAPAEIRKRVDDALSQVGMSEFKTAQPHYLSGGQKQRVAIAGVLAMKSDCIVLDEPTAMLDPQGRKEVLDAVLRLNRESGITVILITHFMEEAALANRILVMEQGKVKLDGTPKEVFGQVAEMTKLRVGVPKITELAYRLNLPTVLTVDEFLEFAPLPKDISPAQPIIKKSIPIVEFKSVTHIYSSGSTFEKTAINDINFKINKGELIAIIGHTGSGKSTLIQHFNSLLKPTSGQVIVDEQDINESKKQQRDNRMGVGLVFQYPEYQLFETTVFRDVAFGPKRMGLLEEEINERVKSALSIVGISEDLYEKSPFELSGGQKRRVAIAGVLAMRPKILVLDEPAAGLDPGGKAEIMSELKKMHEELGMTIVVVSHSMDDVAAIADRILVLGNGSLVCEGTPKEVFAQAKMLQSIGLDVPEICKLFTALGKNQGIFTIEEAVEVLS